MNDKISVIVPTLWRVKNFTDVLLQLSAHEKIGEIILIDNSESSSELHIHKVLHIREQKNTYVYPAWNKGVRMAKYQKLCFLNDDITFDMRLFDVILPKITDDKGMIGLWEFHGKPIIRNNDDISIAPINHRNSGYGCLWFIHKSRYMYIPEEMKIWYGDDWLFNKLRNTNYGIYNLEIHGVTSATSNHPEFNQIKLEDSKAFHGKYQSGHQ